MLKKTTLAILGLAASGFASAGMYSTPPAPSCTPGDVTVPCVENKWDLGVQALYLKPVYSAAKGYNLTNPLTSNFQELDSKWDWGYRLEGSYHFNTGNDLSMTWIHYDVNSNHGNYTGALPLPFTSITPFSTGLANKFDQVNLVMGQHVDFGLLKNARFYGGLQYAKIRVDQRNHFATIPAAYAAMGVGAIDQFDNSDFNGAGPVVGIDYSYDLPQSFSITANTAGSILYGSSRYSSGVVLQPNGLVPISAYANKKSIVPSLEAKLGLNYAYEMAQGALNIEGGYQAINYFSALENRTLFGFGNVASSDFGLYGPYLGIKWVANA